jgi:TonB family protein
MTKVVICFFFISSYVQAQQLSKECFRENGTLVDEKDSEYCVVGKKVWRIDAQPGKTDTVDSYVDTVRAYYTKSRKLKFLKIYDQKGFLEGNFVEYFLNGKMKEQGSYKNGNKSGYVVGYYPDGKSKYTLQYSPDERVSDWDAINFKIMHYWDSTRSQLVNSGNGYCRCSFTSGRIEIGKIVDGLRDSAWSEYSGDTLILREYYEKGKLINGIRNYKGREYRYSQMQEQPSYATGYQGMLDIIKKNMRYPKQARQQKAYGTVYITFVVRANGTVGDIKVLRGVSAELDQEALRVVKLIDDWIPGKLRGKPVNVRFNIPIKFNLN